MEPVNVALEPLRVLVTEIGAFLPRLLVAFVILIAGWIVARLLRLAAARGLRAINLHVLTERAGVDAFLECGGIRADTVTVFALLVYWIVILATLMAALSSLGLTQVTALIERVVLFIPRLAIAILVLVFGAYFARFVSATVTAYFRNVGIADAEILGRIVLYAIMTFVVVIALDPLDIAGDIIHNVFLILVAGVVLALALAFGIGGQKWAAAFLERLWSSRGGHDQDQR